LAVKGLLKHYFILYFHGTDLYSILADTADMLIKKKLQAIFYSGMLLLMLSFFACKQKAIHYDSPVGYNLNQPYVIKLPAELVEISGMAYYAKDNSLFAESDEKGGLYKIMLNRPSDIRKWKFSHKRDYEDVVLHDSTFYVLSNSGDIFTVDFIGDSVATNQYAFAEKGNHSFESLFFDDTLQKLVLICKECDMDEKSETSTYTFDPQSHEFENHFSIDTKEIDEMTNPNSTRFKPSAAAINPVTGELYIVSAINELLVVTDRSGNIKNMYRLNSKIFNHPEGIAFTPAGNLFISNEGEEFKPATILYYQYQPKTQNK
jgi:uncharacterized protein YjiK